MLLSILLTIHILVCIALIGVILLQRSEGGAFGMGGGGGSGSFMTARGAGDLLTRITAILATVFFVLSLVLTLLSGRGGTGSVVDGMNLNKMDISGPTAPAPATPTAPAGDTGALQAPVPQVGGTQPSTDAGAAPFGDPTPPATR